MRHGAKRLMSLLTALVMVSSLLVTPAAAVENRGTGDAGDKITVTSYSGENVKYGNEGYFIAIDADNTKYNTNMEGLKSLVQDRKPSYTAIGSDGKTVTLNATWTVDESNPKFEPAGYIDKDGNPQNVWYYFTAELKVVKQGDKTVDPDDYYVDLPTPKAYVRVYPVKAVQTLDPESMTVSADEVSNYATLDDLHLPEKASITYKYSKHELEGNQEPASTFSMRASSPLDDFMQFPSEEDVVYISTDRSAMAIDETPEGEYEITGWEMNGEVLEPSSLQEIAEKLNENEEKTIALTPVYKDVDSWATVLEKEKAKFPLIITKKEILKGVTVIMPRSEITYGETELSDKPHISYREPDKDPVKVESVKVEYVGINGTAYGPDEAQPKDAGVYRAIATLISDTQSGRWASKEFTINPKEVEIEASLKDARYLVSSITPTPKEYDGNQEVELNTAEDLLKKAYENDDVRVKAAGYFNQMYAGKVRATITAITLTGKDADNYQLYLNEDKVEDTTLTKGDYAFKVLTEEPKEESTTFTITPRALTIDPNGVTVKKIDETTYELVSAGLIHKGGNGEGVIDNEVKIDTETVKVSATGDTNANTVVVTLADVNLAVTNPPDGMEKEEIKQILGSYDLEENPTTKYIATIEKGSGENPSDNLPVLDTDFEVTGQRQCTYDGKPHEVTVQPVGNKNLGNYKVKYGDSADAPTDAGIYPVTVDFEGKGEVSVGNLTIFKVESATVNSSVQLHPGKNTVVLNTLQGLNDDDKKEAKINGTQYISGSTVYEIGKAENGNNFFELSTLPVEQDTVAEKPLTLTLQSKNYKKLTLNLTVTVSMDGFKIIPPTTTLKQGPFTTITPQKDIIELSGGSVEYKGQPVQGTFALQEPDYCYTEGGTYDEVRVLFTSTDEKYKLLTMAPVNPPFTIEGGSGGGDDELAKNPKPYFVIYANSEYNTGLDGLKSFVAKKKPKHKIDETEYNVTWESVGNRAFAAKGLTPHTSENGPWYDWYNYTATAGNTGLEAYVTVIPVNATLRLEQSTKLLQTGTIKGMTGVAEIGLPKKVSAALDPVVKAENATEKWKDKTEEWSITGWKMENGQVFDLKALQDKAGTVTNENIDVKLTPVCATASWATVNGSMPTFTLTLTPKTMVDVTWNGPSDITYGETLNLGTPKQEAIGDNDIDENDKWKFFFYNSDGTSLEGRPTNAGTYKVQAVLVSETHSGASEMKPFEIKPKSINGAGFTFTPPANMSLTYNKQPQTPEYTVKDGNKTLTRNTDYTVGYTNNTNAGTAKVTFTGKGNYSGEKEVTFTIQKCPLTSDQKPTITGTAVAGQVLTASLTDVDADAVAWEWKVGGKEATGYTDFSYVVKPEDSNKPITVQAKAMLNGNYKENSSSAVSDPTALVEKYTVTGTVIVEASGTTGENSEIVVGTKLTAAANVTPSAAETGGTWSWKVDGTVKEGADSNTYTVADGDEEIIAVFTPGEDYEGTIESAAIEVGKAPLSGTVSVTGGTDVGNELTASVTDGPEDATFVYTWLRDGQPIGGATEDKYTITKDDRGKTISVKVTAEGYTGELVSIGSSISAGAPSEPKVEVTAGNKKLDIRWSVEDNGGAPITKYELQVSQASYTVLNITLAANVTSYTLDNGLVNGAPCEITVKAVNSDGSYASGTVTSTPTAPPTPENPNPGGGGGGIGGGGGGGGAPGGDTPTTPDEKTTTVETLEDGTVVTTVQDSQGYLARTEERPDGSILSTVHHTDGCNGTIETDTSGKTVAVADVPAEVAGGAVDGSAVPLPVVGIWANRDIDKAPAMVVNTFGVDGVKVRVPVENKSLTVVAVEIKSDGTPVIVKNTIPTEDGIQLRMNHLEVIRFLDNDKAFADTQDHWAADAVDFVSSRELFNGTAPNTFAPDDKMTRGMLVTVLARYEDVDTQGGATWYEKGADWAKTNGLSDGTRLNDNLTREQLATIMYRYVILKGKLSASGGSLSGYTDADSVSDWSAEAMSWAVGVGLINGTMPATLDPQGSATRAQVAAILMRYAEMFGL